MVDPALMKGDDWVRCCICGDIHHAPYPRLATDREGNRWDVCEGDCADDAGLDMP